MTSFSRDRKRKREKKLQRKIRKSLQQRSCTHPCYDSFRNILHCFLLFLCSSIVFSLSFTFSVCIEIAAMRTRASRTKLVQQISSSTIRSNWLTNPDKSQITNNNRARVLEEKYTQIHNE